MRRYLISGLCPGATGVGRLMKVMVPLAKDHGYTVIYKEEPQYSLKQVIKRPWVPFQRALFPLRMRRVRNAKVVLIHPQTIGFKNFLQLIEANTDVSMYVMDNSFFCIKSYNCLDSRECVRCVSDADRCDASCRPFPINYDKQLNLQWLKQFQTLSHKVFFFVQNAGQEALIKKHFGPQTRTRIIGMNTGEIDFDEVGALPAGRLRQNVVYHGDMKDAKGFRYVLELSKFVTSAKIVVPHSVETLRRHGLEAPYGQYGNVIFQDLKWETGLKEQVINAKLVLNPSVWSASIEGALLKSLAYNGNVAVYDTVYGFQKELPEGILMRLNDDLEASGRAIDEFVNSGRENSAASLQWLKDFLGTSKAEAALFN